MKTVVAALTVAAFVPTSVHAAPGDSEQAEIDRAWRIGSGLLWGGVATSGAAGLTFLGLIPAHRNVRDQSATVDLCMVPTVGDPMPVCTDEENRLAERTRTRTAVAVAGSLGLVAGMALIGVGVWKRRDARRRQESLDARDQPEWSFAPVVTRETGGLAVLVRF